MCASPYALPNIDHALVKATYKYADRHQLSIHLVWTLGHKGIHGNKAVDTPAKEAAQYLPFNLDAIPRTDLFRNTMNLIHKRWLQI